MALGFISFERAEAWHGGDFWRRLVCRLSYVMVCNFGLDWCEYNTGRGRVVELISSC